MKRRGGDPLFARHMGGRVPPSFDTLGGGGIPPLGKLLDGSRGLPPLPPFAEQEFYSVLYSALFFSSRTTYESTTAITEIKSPTRIVKRNPERKTAGSRSVNATTPPAAVANVNMAA